MSRSRIGSGAVEHEQSNGGPPEGNTNAQKRVPLPDWLNLESPDGVRRFMREILVPSALSGKLGVRVVSAVTTACKVLLDSQEAELLERLEERVEALEKRREAL
jgi:hypothetical protein